MATDKPDASWQRIATRGAIIGLVVAAHLAVMIAVLVLAKPRRLRLPAVRRQANVLRVELLMPLPPRPILRLPKRRLPAIRTVRTHKPPSVVHNPPARATPALQASLVPAPSGTAANAEPAFIAGGGFDHRLQQAKLAPQIPKLPGGHLYMKSGFAFVPVQQETIAAKVHKYAGFVLGWFDPVCKNTEYELAKSRRQMLADGYTWQELQRRLRKHHCG